MSEQVEYSWRDGFIHRGMSPVLVSQELDSLHACHGSVTTELLVEVARNPDSEMHKYFDWKDDEAAFKWRKQQSRQLLNSIRIKVVGDSDPRPLVVSVKYADGGRAYQKASVAVQDRDIWDQVMLDTKVALSGTMKRLRGLIAIEMSDRRQRAQAIKDAVEAAFEMIPLN